MTALAETQVNTRQSEMMIRGVTMLAERKMSEM
jgi:hypothetical protein